MSTEEKDVLRVKDLKANFVGERIKIRQFAWTTDTKELVVRDESGYNFIPSTVEISDVNGLLDALNGKEDSFVKNTAFNKNFGTTVGTVAQGNDSRIDNGQTAFGWGDHSTEGYITSETDPTVPDHVKDITTTDITNWDGKVDANADILPGTNTKITYDAKGLITGSASAGIADISGLQTALNGKEDSFVKNTAFNKNFGTTIGTVAAGDDSRIVNGQTAFGWGDHSTEGYITSETDPTVPAHVKDITTTDITNWNEKEDVANKKTDLTDNNDTSYPSVKAVNDALDTPTKLVDQGFTYETVRIGDKLYTVQNFRGTAGAGFGFGVDNPDTWSSLTTAGWCRYDNDPVNEEKYGKLYNWWAVDSLVLPDGWRVPTKADFEELQNYLIKKGYNWDGSTLGNKVGKSMASKGGEWHPSGTVGHVANDQGSNNSSGFTALPGGHRSDNGNFQNVSFIGHWWSATEYGASLAYHCSLTRNIEDLEGFYNDKRTGLSVRLVRDVSPVKEDGDDVELRGNLTVKGRILETPARKSIVIENPDTDDITFFKAESELKVTKVYAVLTGDPSGSVTFNIASNEDRTLTPTNVFTSDQTCTSYTTGHALNPDNESIGTGSWVWVTCNTTAGVDVTINITLEYELV